MSATVDSLVTEAMDNVDYDTVGSTAKCKALIVALRKLRLLRPRSVSLGGNPVSFDDLMQMLSQAEAWLSATNGGSTDASAAGGNGGQSNYYDLSDIRR